jgi:hypothetical protein
MTSSTSSRLFKVAMGLTLVAMGAVGIYVVWRGVQRAEETRKWKPVEAIIISSQLLTDRPSPHSPLEYTAEVHYRYTYEGKSFTGNRVRRVSGPSTHRENAEAVVAEHRPGTATTCYVNPAQPDFAILEHEGFRPLFMIVLPLLIIVGGGGMVVSAFRANA